MRGARRAALPLLAAALAALPGCSVLFGESAPEREGTAAVPGLAAPVEVVRDRFGVPHLYATSSRDLFLAQGFVHAQERLFQMDLERRVAKGELAELFGPETLPADRLFRHLGFAARAPRILAAMPPSSRDAVRAYCDGVNAGMASLKAWPVEFRLLSAAPRPFSPEDVIAGGLLKSFGLSQWWEEAVLHLAARRLPAAQAAELIPRVLPGSPSSPEGRGAAAPALRRAPGREGRPRPPRDAARLTPVLSAGPPPDILVDGLASLRRTVGDLPRSGGSNAWAVSGRRSATGNPILSADPHLLLPSPSLWFENHLVAPGIDVYGVSFPGAPGVIIGHNPWIAWGLTNAMLDDADFFVERLDGGRVMHRGAWVPLTVRRERIAVRGGGSEDLTVRETPHGPILSPVLPGVREALALRWVGFDGGDLLGPILALDRARDREEFLAAAAAFAHPAQVVVYADRHGSIGAVLVGRVPVRRGGRRLLPVPGDRGEWEWTGTVPFERHPRVFDPPGGFVAAANFPVAGDAFPHYLSALYEPPDRGRRIVSLLAGGGTFTVERFERMQADVAVPSAAGAADLALRAARRRAPSSPDLERAAGLIAGWDGVAAADSAGAALFEAFYAKMAENLLRDDLGPDLYGQLARSNRLLWNVVDRAVARGDSAFLSVAGTGRRETLEELASRSLEDAMALLRHRLGGAVSTWRWGRIHEAVFEHPFGKNRYLRRWFCPGPFPVPGDGKTVWKGEFRYGGGDDFSVTVGPSMRQVVPLGFRAAARSVLPTGQSGHFFEPHYRDQAPLWLACRLRPAWTDRRDVEANAEARQRLVPPGTGEGRKGP